MKLPSMVSSRMTRAKLAARSIFSRLTAIMERARPALRPWISSTPVVSSSSAWGKE